jgi:acetyl esterase/lipase
MGLFLSAWIVISAPNSLLLPLGVVAPELSPWLLVLNAIALLVALTGKRQRWLHRLALAGSVIGLCLSSSPLVQLPVAEQQMTAMMQNVIGKKTLEQLGSQLSNGVPRRSQPFVLVDAFTGINPGQARYTAKIPFAAPDGVPLRMDVYRPPQVGTYPGIVVIYGGSWQQGNPSQDSSFNYYMAARGYTVFAIDYRHAPHYRFPAQLDDVRTALSFIRQHAAEYETDPQRLALLGRSAGAHLALLAAYQPQFPIRGVVSYYGPIDLKVGYAEPPHPDPLDVRVVLEAFLGGSPDQLPQLYEIASPISYTTRPLPPTLLVQGRRDHIVEVRFAQQLYKRLQATGNTAILLEIPWAEHAFDAIFHGPSNQLALYYTERFLAWVLR